MNKIDTVAIAMREAYAAHRREEVVPWEKSRAKAAWRACARAAIKALA